ncbi:hypothetical protein BDV96DRAFT_595611 [Lophiotrema nucula]|uniref:Uncharacterized protein n=1 Tax=Lophiotrema nucula TaxID=690887 RepID=A0A6A5ZP34_9PLEO|nr:hypothetical protein BDV96DRAFT_595611 [Lophiotrema nucula]
MFHNSLPQTPYTDVGYNTVVHSPQGGASTQRTRSQSATYRPSLSAPLQSTGHQSGSRVVNPRRQTGAWVCHRSSSNRDSQNRRSRDRSSYKSPPEELAETHADAETQYVAELGEEIKRRAQDLYRDRQRFYIYVFNDKKPDKWRAVLIDEDREPIISSKERSTRKKAINEVARKLNEDESRGRSRSR